MGYSHLNLAAVVLAGFVSVSTTTAQAPRVDLHGDPLPPGVLARLGTVRLRHVPSGGSGIHGIFRPDSRAILTANEYSVRLWDARTGKRLWHLATRGFINSVCFAPDGKTVAVATGGAILLVDAATGKQQHRLGAKAVEYTRLAFAPDGELLAAICNEKPRGVELYDPGSGKQVGHLQTDGPTPYGLAFTPDGKTLTAWGCVAENDPRKVRLLHFDVGTRKQRDVVTIEAATYGGGLAPDGRTLATRDSQTRHLQLWETVTGRTLGELPERTDYWNFTPDSTKVVTVRFGEGDGKNDARLTVWDVATRKPVLRHTCPKRLAASPSFAPDGKSFLFVFNSQLMHLRDAATGKRLLNFPAHEDLVTSLAFTPDGRTLVSAGFDGSVRIWDAASGRQLREFPSTGFGSTVALAPNGKTGVASGRMAASWFDVATGAVRCQLPRGAAGLPKGSRLLVGDVAVLHAERGVVGWGVVYQSDVGETGRRLLRWDANGKLLSSHALPGSLGGLRFSPGARRLAVLRYPPPAKGTEKDVPEVNQSSAVVLDTMTGRPLVTLKQPDSLEPALAFSPDEQTLATVTASYRHEKEGHVRVGLTVRLWELCSGKERKKIELKSIPSAYGPPHVAVGPGGRVLAVGREDQRVQLFDAITGAELAFLPGSDTALGGLAFRPDGKALVTGHADGAILIWDLARVRVPALRPPADRAAAWADLASLDAKKAHAAGWALAADPGAVAFIRQHLALARPTDAAQLKQLLTDLGNARFAVRQKAMRELDALGDRARAALRGWLGENPPLEVRQRIEQLLARLDGPQDRPEWLRGLRAVEVLERIGSDEARRFLAQLAGGAPGADLTRQAADALRRRER